MYIQYVFVAIIRDKGSNCGSMTTSKRSAGKNCARQCERTEGKGWWTEGKGWWTEGMGWWTEGRGWWVGEVICSPQPPTSHVTW